MLLLTFLCYTTYHMSRKSISIVKSQLHLNCSAAGSERSNDTAGCSWAPFDQDNYKELFGALDNAFLVAYTIAMFFSGIFSERLPLRYYLSVGMLLSGLFSALFGLGYFWDIHALWYFIIMQIFSGLAQTTGWPAVVTCMGNWFGKGKRGLIMGVWNSHTSVGNILGSLIAGVWVTSAWGLSFIVPGAIIAAMGVVCFFFLVEHPEDVGCSPPLHHTAAKEKEAEAGTPDDGPLSTSSRTSLDRSESTEEPKAISFLRALRIPGVVEFSLSLLFAKMVSYTFLYWLPLYIANVAHFGAKQAGNLSTLFDVGGIFGGIIAGLVSDYAGGRAVTCCVMLVIAAPMLFLYNHIGQDSIGTSIAMLIVCGGLVNGPYTLITTAVSADLGTHESLKGNAKALSTVAAIIDGTGSIGAALGPLLAGLISPTGWNNVFYMLITADVLACLLLSRLMVKEVRGWRGCVARKRGFAEF
uniref:Glucose-6-phosphate exchanger SLC37A2 n=2 Tax=Dromaius novaehollandiae TaxID=8790 RepID=A0A8C4KF21_DRONO|nr:glucose-6-phosphate exchanger SLC37A2 isoform X1 [Dromaius novaehollandiae]